jgi:hypothetical protein
LEEEERWRCSGGGGWRWLEAVPLLPPPLFNVPVTPVATKQQDDDEESRRCLFVSSFPNSEFSLGISF